MKVFVTAKPCSGTRSVKKISENHFVIAVKEAPFKGFANKAIAAALADFFNIPKSRIIIIKGITSRQKVFEVLG